MKIAIFQLNSALDFKENLETIHKMGAEAKLQGAEAFFLPECFYSMSDGTAPSPYLVEDNNEHFENIKEIATKHQVFLIGGSVATLHEGKVVNRAYNFDPTGKLLGKYDKVHLFSCDIQKPDQRKTIDEADIYTPGSQSQMLEFNGIKVGLGICFDIRYPEMARTYVHQGAKILTFASAFTVPTGKAHWHTLNRARAIENQCFVVASAQWGKHNERIITYGHSLVIDPWGDVLVDLEEGVGFEVVDLDFDRLDEVRKAVKVFK